MSFSSQERDFLAAYNSDLFDKPSVTVDMLIFAVFTEAPENKRKLPEQRLKLLLVKRSNHPHQGKWALPGGFVRVDEALETAAQRVLHQKTGLSQVYLEQLYTWGDVSRDPRTRVISTSYLALVDGAQIKPTERASQEEAQWFDVSCLLKEELMQHNSEETKITRTHELNLRIADISLYAFVAQVQLTQGRITRDSWSLLERNDLAFDHAKFIVYGLNRIRSKLMYTDLAFSLMPDHFTLTALQQVYETLLERPLLKANFRRKLQDMVLETEIWTKDASHRPSRLYRFNSNWQATQKGEL